MLRFALFIMSLLILSGCKLHVIALKGGEVQSIASGTCLEQTNCEHVITDSTFNESFEAVAAPGYYFERWHGDETFLCRGSVNPICVVDTTMLAGQIPDSAYATFDDAYLMPIFSELDALFDFNTDGVLPSDQGATFSGSLSHSETDYVSVSGGILTLDTLQFLPEDAFASYELPLTIDPSCNLVIEWRIQLHPVVSNDLNGTLVDVSDGTHRWFFYLYKDGMITYPPGGGLKYAASLDTSDGFHTYRVESPPNSSSYNFFVDGVQTSSDDGESTTATSRLIFGDVQGAPGSTLSLWDSLTVQCVP